MKCITCDNSGYLNANPDVYCDCDAGIFYEGRNELRAQIQEGVLDIGQDDDNDYNRWLNYMYEEGFIESENYREIYSDDPYDYIHWNDDLYSIIDLFEDISFIDNQ